MKLANAGSGRAAPQIAVTKLDPTKIPPGKWQVIPTYRVAGTVHVQIGHLIQGRAPTCFSTVAAPPCQARPLTVLRNGHLTHLTSAEARKRAVEALAAFRAAVHDRSSDAANSGNSGNSGSGTSMSGNSGNSGSGNSGTSTSTATQAPLPAATWVVGCYVHVPAKQQPNAGNSGNSGNSGTSGNS